MGLFNFLPRAVLVLVTSNCILWFEWLRWREQHCFYSSETLVCLTSTKQTSNFIICFMKKLAPPIRVITRNISHLSVTLNFKLIVYLLSGVNHYCQPRE